MRLRSLASLGTFAWAVFLPSCNAVLGNDSAVLGADGGEVESGAVAPGPTPAGSDASADATVGPPSDDSGAPGPGPNTFDASPDTGSSPTPPPFDAGTVPTCSLGQKLCGGACVAVDDAQFGCTQMSCDPCVLPHATSACADDTCAIGSCEAGYADCDQDPTNGCETDLSQPGHCGTCNAVCSASEPYCTPAGGGTFTCSSSCPSLAPTLCTGQCVDLSSSLDDCGQCGTSCPATGNGTATCVGGHCGFVCTADFHACGAACASDLSTATCGSSCSPCPTGPNAVPTCSGTACGIACQPGYANCDGSPSDGCEIDLLSSSTNCGACGFSCDGRACHSGVCAPAPVADSGPPPPPPVDAGEPDTGTPPPADAGQHDSGPPVVDSGMDSAPTGESDAEAPQMDAGVSD